ncbi:MAG: hypothetical protein PHO89_04480 [Methylacidiphilaceae bacterium]|nr:hypothetical protein [Candidatus Methylacidiphilaceae bacterium]
MSSGEPSEDPKAQDKDPSPKQGKSLDRNFYWVIALASLFFLYLIYSVLNHDTVNIHGH